MNDSNATPIRHIQAYPIARVSAVVLTLACVACSSEDDGSGEVPAFSGAFGGSSTNPGSGATNAGVGGGNAPSGGTGGNGGAGPSNEQPAAGNGTPIGSSAGGGGATNGSAGSSMVAAGGSSMVAPGPAAGAGGQGGMPTTNECEGGALFCEDFDGLALGALQAGSNGLVPERTVNVVTDPVRGQVLQVQAGPGYGAKAGVFLNDVVLPDNSHFGRMFVNVAQFPVADGDHWVIVEATGNGGDQVRPVGGQFQRWAPGSDGPSAGDWTDWQQSTVATAAGAWECVEWQMNGANGGNDIVLWVDDVQVQPLDRPAFSFPAINRLWFGWVVYQMGAPNQYDVRIDDIVLSTQRVGCN